MSKRVKTGTLFSIVASLWIGFVGATSSGCKDEDPMRKNIKHCETVIDEHYPSKAKEYCGVPCVRDYVKATGKKNFRGEQVGLAIAISECFDRKENPDRYEGQVSPAVRHRLGRLLDDAYKRGQ